MSAEPGRTRARRPDPSFSDVVRVVALLAGGVLVVGWFGGLFRSDTVVEPRTVDYRGIAAAADADADFPLAAPDALPAGWRATSARWEPADQRWHLGILTGDDDYVEVEQSAGGDPDDLLPAAAEPAGGVDVDGTRWQRFTIAGAQEVALLRRSGAVLTMVAGSVGEPELVAFTAGLGV